DEFIEPPGTGPAARITKPTKLTNVYAILRGTDPAQANRKVIVTGHYDSRNSDNFNTHDPAPGANDDASGTAVSLESARVLSEGVPGPATLDQLREIQTIGAENDSPARELARAIVDIDLTYFHPTS